MIVIDTNILLYAADHDSEFYSVCRETLEEWRRQAAPVFLTWSICYEFLRVSTHPRVFRTPWGSTQAWQFLAAFLAAPAAELLRSTPRHTSVLAQTLRELPDLRGNVVHDVHTAVLMREHGVSRVCTRDTDFHRFPFITVVDPLRSTAQ